MKTIPLKRLSLQGYKSFARKTEFPFEHHVTAIVGPNGSGKSNLIDAVRWALGEQSYTSLRSQRTEDMIFHGSEGHRRMGMAQVSLTFDNQDGWLPIDFGEVTISRRADRSGTNHYLINGNRVRLRDIVDLLAQSGVGHHPYTIIGQGLVDRVLTLHPQERRTLIEEAAGVVGYQRRRDQVMSQLQEVHNDLVRVHDIVSEIEPRLARLAQQAERAEEHVRLGQELEEALTTWYGYQWHVAVGRLETARSQAQRQASELAREAAKLEATQQQLTACQTEYRQLEAEESDIQASRGELTRTLGQLDQRQAILRERNRLLRERRAEAAQQKDTLRQQYETQTARMRATEAALAQLEEQRQAHQARIDVLSARLADLGQARSQLQAREQSLRREASDLTRAQAQRQAELDHLRQRETELLESRAAAESTLRTSQEVAATLRARQQNAMDKRQGLLLQRSTLEAQLRDWAQAQRRLGERLDELREARNSLEQRKARLSERRDLLSRMRLQLHRPGGQAVRRAAERGEFATSAAAVAELLEVPAQLQAAVQAALEDRLHDLVVEDQAAAEQVLAFLQQSQGGRATLWPLDVLCPPKPIEVPQATGVVGRASDIVTMAVPAKELAACLLNRTLIVEDIEAARGLAASLVDGCQIVTMDGQVMRSEGAISGGSALEPESLPLGLEEEWRQLASAEEQLQVQLHHLALQEQAWTTRSHLHRQRGDELESQAREAIAELQQQTMEAESADEAVRESEREFARVKQELVETEREIHALSARIVQTGSILEHLEARIAETQLELAKAEDQDAQAALTEEEDQRRKLEHARTALAVTQEGWAQQRQRLEEAQVQSEQLSRQLRRVEDHERDSNERVDSLQAELEQLQQNSGSCRGDLEQLSIRYEPIRERLQSLKSRQTALDRMEQDLQLRQREIERRAQEAQLAADRRRDDLLRLGSRITEDLGLTNLPEYEIEDIRHASHTTASQPPLPLDYPPSSLPSVEQIPEGLQDSIRIIRSRLKRLGQINPEAPAEYAELRNRHIFLTEQASDLEGASDSLRRIIDELDQTIQRQILGTFQTVSAHFTQYFALLFEGGEAQLSLSEPNDISRTGIDIEVRPPGKRSVRLELLSGGERALTTIALIFAVLAASPTPFCLLDEVDATLDEANSRRLRHLLEKLAGQTQFVVITHNREVVEAADTIYGLSMDDEGVTQAISLQLGEAVAAIAH